MSTYHTEAIQDCLEMYSFRPLQSKDVTSLHVAPDFNFSQQYCAETKELTNIIKLNVNINNNLFFIF